MIRAVCLLAVAVLLPLPAGAQEGDVDARARQLFEEGREHFAAQRYEQALDRFQRSYDLSHRSMLLYNIGLSADRSRHDQQALDAYEAYLRQVPDATNRAEVEERVRVIRRALARTAPVGDDPGTPSDEGDSPGLLSRWWFWAIVAVVLVGGTAGVLLATASEEQEPPLPGNVGGVIMVLEAP